MALCVFANMNHPGYVVATQVCNHINKISQNKHPSQKNQTINMKKVQGCVANKLNMDVFERMSLQAPETDTYEPELLMEQLLIRTL